MAAAPVSDEQSQETASIGADLQAGMDELLAEFDKLLSDDSEIDQDTRDALQQHFGQALEDAAKSGDVLATMPDRSAWIDAVRTLQDSGAVAEDEAGNLIRQLDQALEPLQRRESQLAIEFSRRMARDGEQEALAWLRQQNLNSAEEQASRALSAAPGNDVPVLRTEAVNSRSRRVRGPPRASR